VAASVQGGVRQLGENTLGFGLRAARVGLGLGNLSSKLVKGLTVSWELLFGQKADGMTKLIKADTAFTLHQDLHQE